MRAGRRALCASGPLCWIVVSQTHEQARWALASKFAPLIERGGNVYRLLIQDGIRLIARSAAIAHAMTATMKGSSSWSKAGHAPFSKRKVLTREAYKWLLKNVELVEPTVTHLKTAGGWWFAHYREDVHEARAGFEDYIDAALVAEPPRARQIRHVIVDHPHLPYILGKRKMTVTAHYLR